MGGVQTGQIVVIGGTGNTGRALVRALADGADNVVAVARSAEALAALGPDVETRILDVSKESKALADALANAAIVVNAAHARYTRPIIAALPGPATRLITLGSTRMFTCFPDRKAAEVADAQAAHAETGVRGLIIHPTMIYGGADNNIRRIIRLVRYIPIIPLPQGGEALLQPIHRNDVVASVVAAIARDTGPDPLIIAGAEPLPYADIVRMCGRVLGRSTRIVSIPVWLLRIFAPVVSAIPGLPTISPDEVQRLTEDKDFDIGAMRSRLGISPIGFEEGLARMAKAGELG